MSSFVPYDYGGEFPVDFWDRIISEGPNNEGIEGWFTDYPDTNPANGYADFVDEYNGEPGIITKPSQGHAGV